MTGLAVAVSPLFRPALNGIFCSIFVSAAGCGVEGVVAVSGAVTLTGTAPLPGWVVSIGGPGARRLGLMASK